MGRLHPPHPVHPCEDPPPLPTRGSAKALHLPRQNEEPCPSPTHRNRGRGECPGTQRIHHPPFLLFSRGDFTGEARGRQRPSQNERRPTHADSFWKPFPPRPNPSVYPKLVHPGLSGPPRPISGPGTHAICSALPALPGGERSRTPAKQLQGSLLTLVTHLLTRLHVCLCHRT